jgi:hypothetical protein
MFDNDIRLVGKHAEILKRYSVDKQAENQIKFTVDDNNGKQIDIHVFETMIQTYMVAGMIGIIKKKISDVDRSSDLYANIFSSAVNKNKADLKRIVQFMNLTADSSASIDGRIKKAFTVKGNQDSEERLNGFVRAGLEVLDEYFCDCRTQEDVANAILSLVEDFGIIVE